MRRLSRRALLGWAGLGAAVPACLSPTLPLPPPDAPDAQDLRNGTYRLTGALPVFASVLIRNQRTSLIFGMGPISEYDLIVVALKGDTMTLWYETDTGDLSIPISFQIDRLTPILNDAGQ